MTTLPADAIGSAPRPTLADRILGGAGVLGGLALLAAFGVDISPDVNWIRLVLFNAGAAAIALGIIRRAGPARPAVLAVSAAGTMLANGWYLVMVVSSLGLEHPGAGEFGFVFFLAGVALWLTDAALGAAILARSAPLAIGIAGRLGAMALAIGSLLAISGMDRLGLTGPNHETVFTTLSLLGSGLNGLGWILLGLEIGSAPRRPQNLQTTAGLPPAPTALLFAAIWGIGAILPVGGYHGGQASLLDQVSIWWYSAMLASLALVATFIVDQASEVRGVTTLTRLLAAAGITGAIGNALEDAFHLAGAEFLYGIGFFGSGIAIIGLVIALLWARQWLLGGLVAATLTGIVIMAGHGPPVVPVLWFLVGAVAFLRTGASGSGLGRPQTVS